MDKINYASLVVLAIFLPLAAFSQTITSKQVNSQNYYSSQYDADANTNVVNTTEQARKKLSLFFNLYRDYSISVDAPESAKKDNETIVAAKSITPVETSGGDFKVYLEKMEGILNRRMEGLTGKTADIQAERSRYLGGLTMLRSAGCLIKEQPKGRGFVSSKSLDGINIIAYSLDSLRQNTRYGTVENYKEGYSRIRKDQVYGFINLCGEEVVTPQYEKAEPFNDGKALVKRVDWFFISPNGEESEPLEGIAEAKALSYGISWARLASGKQVLFNNDFDTKRTFISQLYDGIDPFFRGVKFRVKQGKKVGVVGSDGKELLPVVYDAVEPTNTEGVYQVTQNNLTGLVDSNWVVRVPPIIQAMSAFNKDGLAILKTEKGYAVLSRTSFKLSKFYSYVSEFNQYGVAVFRDEKNLLGLMDAQMNIIVEPKYASIGDFGEAGMATACHPDGKCGFIHWQGHEQIKAAFEAVSSFNKFGFAVAKVKYENCLKEGETCIVDVVIDKSGAIVVPVSQENIERGLKLSVTDSIYSDNFLVVDAISRDGLLIQKMLISLTTRNLITPAPLEMVTPMDNLGVFRVRKNNLWGMIDTTGKILTKMQYREISRPVDEYYAAQNDKGKWGYLNKKGRAQIPFEYEDAANFRAGFAAVSKGKGKWGLINRFNAKIVPCIFKSVELAEKGNDIEIRDAENLLILLDREANCKTNCPKFEAYRTKANKEEEEAKK